MSSRSSEWSDVDRHPRLEGEELMQVAANGETTLYDRDNTDAFVRGEAVELGTVGRCEL